MYCCLYLLHGILFFRTCAGPFFDWRSNNENMAIWTLIGVLDLKVANQHGIYDMSALMQPQLQNQLSHQYYDQEKLDDQCICSHNFLFVQRCIQEYAKRSCFCRAPSSKVHITPILGHINLLLKVPICFRLQYTATMIRCMEELPSLNKSDWWAHIYLSKQNKVTQGTKTCSLRPRT